MLALDDVEPADTRPDMHADAFVIFGGDLQAGSLDRFVGRGDGEVNEPGHLFNFFFLDEIQRVEIFHLGSDLASEVAGVEQGNPANTTPACEQGLPRFCRGIPYTADHAQACHYDPASQIISLPWRACRCSRRHPARCGSFPRLRPESRYRRLLRRPSPVRPYPVNRRLDRPQMRRSTSLRLRPLPTAPQ